MKTFLLILLTPIVLFANTHPDSMWVKKDQFPDAVNGRFEDLFFLTPTSGYGITFWGIMFGFDSTGVWQYEVLDSTGVRRGNTRSIGFHTKQKGWLGTLDDKTPLLGTEDGGKTWKPVPLPEPRPRGICGMSIVNDSVMYGSGAFDVGDIYAPTNARPVVIKTLDGGKTFHCIDMSAYTLTLVDCRFTSKDSGIVSGSVGGKDYKTGHAVVLTTTDGGQTWKTVYQSPRIGEQGWKIFFRTSTEGYVALQSPKASGAKYIIRTTDGGASWKELFIGDCSLRSFPQGVCFPDAKNGIVGGYGDTVFTTSDGGASWEKFYAPDMNGINRSRRVNDTTMYVIASKVFSFRPGNLTSVREPSFRQTVAPYPNPSNEYVMLTMPFDGICAIDIINEQGVVCSSILGDMYAKVLTDKMANGVYTARIRSHYGETTLRFVVVK